MGNTAVMQVWLTASTKQPYFREPRWPRGLKASLHELQRQCRLAQGLLFHTRLSLFSFPVIPPLLTDRIWCRSNKARMPEEILKRCQARQGGDQLASQKKSRESLYTRINKSCPLLLTEECRLCQSYIKPPDFLFCSCNNYCHPQSSPPTT